MSVAILAQGLTEDWVAALREAVPDLRVQVWPEIAAADAIEAALIWKSDPAILAGFPDCASSCPRAGSTRS
jgi:hypothetical protein